MKTKTQIFINTHSFGSFSAKTDGRQRFACFFLSASAFSASAFSLFSCRIFSLSFFKISASSLRTFAASRLAFLSHFSFSFSYFSCSFSFFKAIHNSWVITDGKCTLLTFFTEVYLPLTEIRDIHSEFVGHSSFVVKVV